MNALNLSRKLASRIVEGLKGRGRILVVKGGTAALVRAVDDAMSGYVEPLAERALRADAADDPTTREALSRLTGRVAQALLASEHLEDVFADRSVVEREVLDAARIALREASASQDEAVVRVELDLLGYVAATAGKRARPQSLVIALERAGLVAGARLESYDPAAREAVFVPEPPANPDLHLELEEAVADELCALVERGVVELPTLERTAQLTHEVSPSERARLTRLIDRAATRTLRRTGNAAQWEIPDGRSVRVVYTPLSEQDARDVDMHVAAFAAEVDTLLADAGAPLVSATAAVSPPPPPAEPARAQRRAKPAPTPEAPEPLHHANGNGAVLPVEEPVEEEAPPSEPAPKPARARATTKRSPRSSSRTPAATRAAAARTTTKKRAPAKRATKPGTTEEGTRKKATKASTKKRALPATTTKARTTKTRTTKKR
ncbi:hypothetical protein [Polyangium jinanense]|uniref:Uncharacterized protein n=1 Tax=Polyangium jinanense TaxID=2829994 RepID=A0A9X4AUS4_9BACT|nr:hypothetical protein [Polyangium jinanense]MDC3958002.1 hypothetical protein [Polyangium jinanense]MDC3983555.1 hypothetical protein [Polyangium jinanense]